MSDNRDLIAPGGRRRGFRLGGDGGGFGGGSGGGSGGSERSAGFGGDGAPPDDPALVEGCILRRIVGYIVDVGILGALGFGVHLLVFISLGLLAPLLYPLLVLLPLVYHTLLVASPASATLGQRLVGVTVRTDRGEQPGLLQAFVMVCLFYLTLTLTSGLLLLWCLFDDRGRCLHDILSGTLVVRADRLT